METLGSISGVTYRFQEGLLDAIEIGSHRTSVSSIDERLQSGRMWSVGRIGSPVPRSLEAGHLKTSDWVPDTGTVMHTVQDLGRGYRELIVFQEKLAVERDEEAHGHRRASLRMLFDIYEAVEWSISIHGAIQINSHDGSTAMLNLKRGVFLEVSCSRPLKINKPSADISTVKIALPIGTTRIELTVESQPVFDVEDTLVVCRSSQLREAAIVLACLQPAHYVPFVVLDEPPMDEANYLDLYRKFRGSLEDTQDIIYRADRNKIDAQALVESTRRRHEFHLKLFPVRSWTKRNYRFGQLLRNVNLKRVILLFDPGLRDFWSRVLYEQLDYEAGETVEQLCARSSAADKSFLPDGVMQVRFVASRPNSATVQSTGVDQRYTYETLADLYRQAWDVLQGSAQPSEPIAVPANDFKYYAPGLLAALRRRVPIRPVGSGSKTFEEVVINANEGFEQSPEAVLIESEGTASEVVAALYAHHVGARIVVSAPPDLTEVENALGAFRDRQSEATRALQYISKYKTVAGKCQELSQDEKNIVLCMGEHPCDDLDAKAFSPSTFLTAVRNFLFADWERDAIAEIENAVTAQVPADLIAKIGEAKLTVFTRGLPYSFVKTESADWSEKPIGHVVSDASLIILTELCARGVRRPVTFNFVLDPGFFKTSETSDVVRSLSRHYTHTITLEGEETVSLIHLSMMERMPTEVLFFNTHGTDNAIMLGFFPLMHYLIPQWITLAGNPIVFNNSCLSWTGVGQEFIRAGARGYIGTLWSVSAVHAAEFARVVMDKIAQDSASVATAIKKTGIKESTAKAYLYVGSVDARMDQWSTQEDLKQTKDYCITALEMIASTIDDLLRSDEHQIQASRRLWKEYTGFKRVLTGLLDPNDDSLLNADISELRLIASHWKKLGIDLKQCLQLSSQALDRAQQFSGAGSVKQDHCASIRHLIGAIKLEAGQIADGLHDLTESVKLSESAGLSPLEALIKISFGLKLLGRWQEAKSTALRAHELAARENDDSGLLMVLGHLGQISKRLQEFDDALEYAQKGFELAKRLKNKKEQMAFKADEAQLLIAKGRLDDAIHTAEEAGGLARLAGSPEGDLKVKGISCNALILSRRLDEAAKIAQEGLDLATKLKDDSETAAFSTNLMQIAAITGDIEEAGKFAAEAAILHVKCGELEHVWPSFNFFLNESVKHGKCLTAIATLELYLAIGEQVDDALISIYYPPILRSFRRLASDATKTDLQIGLPHLYRFIEQLLRECKGERQQFLFVLADIIAIIVQYGEGQKKEARRFARELDQASNGAFKLEELLLSIGDKST